MADVSQEGDEVIVVAAAGGRIRLRDFQDSLEVAQLLLELVFVGVCITLDAVLQLRQVAGELVVVPTRHPVSLMHVSRLTH